ncbi:MAG: 4a-hydroxytetrahydrobiopterin dehydratase [Saprospiraceae bacterium]|nr:4a-hydroxytetrahydrobiopterin dehydratase [Saprospiraceae bacterium]
MQLFKEKENSLQAVFLFNDFINAFAFMTEAAIWAEKQNHHPEWSNVYNRVEVILRTHDAGNIVTSKDYKLAEKMEEIYIKYKEK